MTTHGLQDNGNSGPQDMTTHGLQDNGNSGPQDTAHVLQDNGQPHVLLHGISELLYIGTNLANHVACNPIHYRIQRNLVKLCELGSVLASLKQCEALHLGHLTAYQTAPQLKLYSPTWKGFSLQIDDVKCFYGPLAE